MSVLYIHTLASSEEIQSIRKRRRKKSGCERTYIRLFGTRFVQITIVYFSRASPVHLLTYQIRTLLLGQNPDARAYTIDEKFPRRHFLRQIISRFFLFISSFGCTSTHRRTILDNDTIYIDFHRYAKNNEKIW